MTGNKVHRNASDQTGDSAGGGTWDMRSARENAPWTGSRHAAMSGAGMTEVPGGFLTIGLCVCGAHVFMDAAGGICPCASGKTKGGNGNGNKNA